MQRRFRFISLFAFILAAALAASGCGGGGGGGGSQTIAPQPAPYDMVVAAIAAADTAEAAQAAYDEASKDEDVSAPQLVSLREALDARVAALNMAMIAPQPAPYDMVVAAIAAADTAEAAQAAYDEASKDEDVSAPQLASLRKALDARVAALNMAIAAAERKVVVDAAMCTEVAQACAEAHMALVAALEADLAALQASDDATNAQIRAKEAELTAATTARDTAKMNFADANRATATGVAVTAAEGAAGMLEDDRSAEAINAAKEAIMAAKNAIAGGDYPEAYSDEIGAAETAVARAEERNMVDGAVMTAKDAADGLVEDSSPKAVVDAQALIDAAKMQVDEAVHLTPDERRMHKAGIDALQTTVAVAKNKNDAAADAVANRIGDEKAEEEEKNNAAMAATAAKLYAGIGRGTPILSNTRDGETQAVVYDANNIEVTIGGEDDAVTVSLSVDKKKPVADNHEWEGKSYSDSEGTYEAVVYSNVGAAEEGLEFSEAYTIVDVTGETTLASGIVDGLVSGRIASSRFVKLAGKQEFPLEDENLKRVVIPGSYHGVSGDYYCMPVDDGCSVAVATSGYTLDGGTWTFKPTNPDARVMSMPDANYASYGWWLHKGADGIWTASAFAAEKGDAADAGPAVLTTIEALRGTATYMGGAAGKYALSSSTGGTNDAGHFTARATLEATFAEEHTISGTIDKFMGADGQLRNWSVELLNSSIIDAGRIVGDGTKWTIDGTAGVAAGQWSGDLQEVPVDGDGVPKVATGTFHSTYGQGNSMVGAFGATNKQ